MLDKLKQAELHVHVGGCLSAEDLAVIAADFYREIDWQPFVENYQRVFNQVADPIAWFDSAILNHDLKPLEQGYYVTDQDSGDFARFQARFDLLIYIARHLRQKLGHQGPMLDRIFARHRREGLRYVEYRAMSAIADTYEKFKAFHSEYATACMQASDEQMTVRYIASLPRDNAVLSYRWLRQLLDELPQLRQTIVGIDFCFWEEGYPPKSMTAFFDQLHADNAMNPAYALDVVYHVGESFFDKSLESAIRWCHEAAMLGAKRLGHAIALGMDPQVAIGRCDEAHVAETVSERLDQIAYDIKHAQAMQALGIQVDVEALIAERDELASQPSQSKICRVYDADRLAEIRLRQQYVLECLTALGTVIETCPTSNLRIGGVPSPAEHPVHRFLESDVNLLIAADDPGIFNVTLADEVDWVNKHSPMDQSQLLKRLGDPMRFALHALE
ncbi:MAG: hypothetical protein ACF8OB_18430 [Phycisphaeraceae bacterium JB051]